MIHIKLGNHMMKSWDYGWFFNNNHSCYYNSNVIINPVSKLRLRRKYK